MLRVQQLAKSFNGQPVVRDLSFEVPTGQTFVLMGKSGCGKTTTLKMINQLVPPDSGSIQLPDGIASSPVEHMRRGIGYVVQDYGLFPHLTVADNVAMVPRLLGFPEAQIAPTINQALALVELETALLNRMPAQLSGGQQQRVAIARAIAAQPKLLLMDEPFSALDPMTRSTARQNFRALTQQLQTTTILVTHDVTEAVEVADQIGLMEDGRFLQVGTAAELLFTPASDAVRSYFRDARLECELRASTLSDLLPHLPATSSEPTESIACTASAFAALQQLADGQANALQIENHSTSITEQSLLQALAAYKASYS